MSKHPYRTQAQQALERAKEHLGDDDRLRYAALELRLAMEALTYDRAQSYLGELSIDGLKWQPKQLMDALIEIDPTAGSTYTLRIGEEPAIGVAPETMTTLGTDTVFGLREIKKHYHATASYLHMPTMQQLADGKGWDPEKARVRLNDTAAKIEASLNSPVWNCTLGEFSSFDCCRCNKLIHKRVQPGQDNLVATCIHCNAPHAGRLLDDGKLQWEPMTVQAPCTTSGCTQSMTLFLDEIKQATCWECPECHKRHRLDLGVVPDVDFNGVLPHENDG